MRVNPFNDLYASCNTGSGPDKLTGLPDGPRIIDLELTSFCNMRCVMCPTGLQALGRPGVFMTPKTFKAILQKTKPFNTALRFIGWGEPTMHWALPDFVRAATAQGRLTHLNTNGSKLAIDPLYLRRLLNAGLSSIKFSFQGVDRESYNAMRRVDFFEELLSAIERVKRARGENPRPFIAASTTTTTESPEQIAAFAERIAPLVDQLTIGRTVFDFIDFSVVPEKRRELLLAAAADQFVERRHPDPCPEVYDKLSIHADGSVRVCCNDYSGHTYLGNIVTNSLEELWHSPVLAAYRERLAAGRYEGPLCSVCYDYMELTEGA